MKNTRSEKGITLVALIITIIVLLILAIVAISAVSGDGILNKAKEATEKTKLAQQEESIRLALDEWKIQSSIPGNEETLAGFLAAKLPEAAVTDDGYGGATVVFPNSMYIVSANGEIIKDTSTSATGGTEEDRETGILTFTSSYTDEQGYIAFAESLGFTVLTMDEYNSEEFSYTKIALPYGVTGEDSDNKFMNNHTITDVLIPNTMTKIGSSMFSECPELKCVYIPGSVKTIEWFAFSYCVVLDTVIFEDTFSGCDISEDSVFYDTILWWEISGAGEATFTINGETYHVYSCFIEGTKVLTPSGLVNIETVEVGDKIISQNNETGKIEEKEVLKVAKHEIKYNTLKIYVADTQIEVTSNHRIYVKGVGYTEAGKLKVGDILVNVNNVEMPIEKIEEVENTGIKRVYNFVVEDNHNYFVGIDSILVHNKCFVAGSKVLTTKGLVNIEDVKVGDYVITYNQETGMNEVHKVTETFIHEKVQDQVTITFGDESKVTMNMYHPLYTEEGWKSLSNFNGYETLEVGDKVKTEEGYKEVSKIEVDLSNSPVDMYTINVEGADNFYVNGTLAHDNEY